MPRHLGRCSNLALALPPAIPLPPSRLRQPDEDGVLGHVRDGSGQPLRSPLNLHLIPAMHLQVMAVGMVTAAVDSHRVL